MKLIVGLGNPDAQYKNTFHNLGFMCVEKVAENLGATFSKEKCRALIAETRVGVEKVILAKPLTYMNLSGIAVGAYANYYNLGNEEIAVIQDDLDLPVGQLRIRKKGSAGGHNGIKSIQEHLGTDEFPRFKVGISHPGRNGKAVVSHVLKPFAGEEKAAIEEAVKKMADALERWIKEDIDAVMNEYNKKPAKPKKEKPQKEEAPAEQVAEAKTEA